jgi:DNA-binding GntR family transcriptional regulator
MRAVSSATSGRMTAQQFALNHLRSELASGVLQPGDRIRQEQLAAELGSSIVPVREALKTLEAEGQIRYLPHRGFQVAQFGLEELIETHRLRSLLEDEAVRIAIDRLCEDDFLLLESAIDKMEQASSELDVTAMNAGNYDFHFTIFNAAGMPRLTQFVHLLWQSTNAYRVLYFTDAEHRSRVNAEHRRVVELLRAKDVDGAVAELDGHRKHGVDSIANWLSRGRPEPTT